MANNVKLTAPQVFVNGELLAIIPNSFEMKLGTGEVNVSTATAGASAVSIHSRNYEEAKGFVKFDIAPTKDSFNFLTKIAGRVGDITIEISDEDTGMSYAFSNMSLTSEPTIATGSDLTMEFEGDPAV